MTYTIERCPWCLGVNYFDKNKKDIICPECNGKFEINLTQ